MALLDNGPKDPAAFDFERVTSDDEDVYPAQEPPASPLPQHITDTAAQAAARAIAPPHALITRAGEEWSRLDDPVVFAEIIPRFSDRTKEDGIAYSRRPFLRADAAGFSTPEELHRAFLPTRMLDRVLKATNQRLAQAGLDTMTMTELRMVVYVIPQLMSQSFGMKRHELWEPCESESPYLPKPTLRNTNLTRQRVDEIMAQLHIGVDPPTDDPLAHVRALQELFNEDVTHVFAPGCVTCLDNSTVAFHNERGPSYLDLERKPHPKGFEYHTLADADTGLATLTRVGVYASAVARENTHWPQGVPGEDIDREVAAKKLSIGSLHTARRILNSEGTRVAVNLYCVPHPDCTLILASTYGSGNPKERFDLRLQTGDTIRIERNVPLQHYYHARHAVHHNNYTRLGRNEGMERAWAPKSIALRHLAFFLSLADANAIRFWNYTHPTQRMTAKEFQAHWCLQTIREYEQSAPQIRSARKFEPRAPLGTHKFEPRAPPGTCADGVVRQSKTNNQHYRRVVCRGKGCSARVRSRCSCSATLWLCHDCWLEHVFDEAP
ncbi:uncharacterized protein MONBRDRAFT_21809 [Monosiga brevicollis MX1]|uniref:PiggyBac transposable element-derived protein domain-containing protein n=1 Tax=Monosiga brevicollis TaxID=81824 RepID=A9UNN9_MONBE|nr:uncharacterized protein MONBRDRAFT_21809 [Monosiga brevicollis MX1]EDQ92275.1 predicted protein [Monosiga brevicollis MX1]|eukprot:XP_001742037.1 hypothetical protein [Monosiga brevicollis MX1]